MSERTLAVIMAFAFGVVFVTALLVFVALVPNPTDRQFEVIRIILALAAGGVASMIPGFLNLKLQTGTKSTIRAGGALAVFVLVYFFSPAHWAQPAPQTIIQHTTGANSPTVNGNGNVVGGPPASSDSPK